MVVAAQPGDWVSQWCGDSVHCRSGTLWVLPQRRETGRQVWTTHVNIDIASRGARHLNYITAVLFKT